MAVRFSLSCRPSDSIRRLLPTSSVSLTPMVSSKNSLGLSERQAMFTAVAFYMLTALIMVNVNKVEQNERATINEKKYSRNLKLSLSLYTGFFFFQWALNKISAPWLLLWSQLLIAVVLLKFTDLVGLLKMPKIQMGVAKQLIPLIAINVIGLGLNTVCLVYVDISFYQVWKEREDFTGASSTLFEVLSDPQGFFFFLV